MKYFFTKYKFFLSGAALILTAASCTSTLSDEPATDARAISFTPAAETRAAVEGGTLPADFLVWGGYSNTLLFEGETVHPNGSYENGTRYWVPGTYNFYAVYPATIKDKTTFSNGSLTVKDFDCSATGNAAVDLMTAIPPSIPYEAGNEPQPVAMEFQHELARVNVTIKTEESTATAVSAKMWGIGYQGNFSKSNGKAQWETLVQAAEGNTPFTRTAEATIDKLGIPLLNEMLLPPQNITDTQGATIYVSYRYTGDNTVKEKRVPLPAITWAAGKSYTYTLTIEPDGRIHFDPPTINEWGEAQGGIIIVA
ncbi:fimbrillin family protein [Mediterranea massiliensis]|uniref:fimbrillin family protein n=1 Tax=Mediterranea massiliensis TaxID=1841865 RepID=UPI00266B9883|nr:fimbrillin family protein [Mediterranea massiliensis]